MTSGDLQDVLWLILLNLFINDLGEKGKQS